MNKLQIFLSFALYMLTYEIAAKFDLFVWFYALAFIFWIYILQGSQNKHSKFSWLLILLINPVVGMLLYNMVGKNYRTSAVTSKQTKPLSPESVNVSNEQFKILAKLGKQELRQNTNITYLNNGETKFTQLLNDLKSAKKNIYLEYYIIEDSDIFQELVSILIDKANNGVKIKILIDAVGSSKFPKILANKLKANHIELAFFGQAKIPIVNNKINFRNHRKIVLIDNKIAYCGGINIADRYIHGNEKMPTWHDTHLKIEGDLLIDLLDVFIQDWEATTKIRLFDKPASHEIVNPNLSQVLASGPDMQAVSIRNVYFKLLTNAKRKIVITTPYLICDDELLLALTTASETGVDVSIIVPGIDEGKLVGKYTRMNYAELLKSGVKIYETKESFIHAKSLYIDDELASTGSMNFDYRSFFLNYEITVFYSDPVVLKTMDKQLTYYIKHSEKINKRMFRHGLLTRITDAIIRPFASLF